MSNRSTEWLIVWSPANKELLNLENTNKLIKVLKKLTTKYNIAYEEGSNNNPHYDIVACFKSKQARSDIANTLCRNLSVMEWWSSNKGPLTINSINDFSFRLGYNLKECLEFPFLDVDTSQGIELVERENAILHYNNTNTEREKVAKIKHRFKYISKKQSLFTLNKYQLSNNIPDPKSKQDFCEMLKLMFLDGYYFDMKQEEKHEIYKFYMNVINQQVSEKDINAWTMDVETFNNHYGFNTDDYILYKSKVNKADAGYKYQVEDPYYHPINIEAKCTQTLEDNLKYKLFKGWHNQNLKTSPLDKNI